MVKAIMTGSWVKREKISSMVEVATTSSKVARERTAWMGVRAWTR